MLKQDYSFDLAGKVAVVTGAEGLLEPSSIAVGGGLCLRLTSISRGIGRAPYGRESGVSGGPSSLTSEGRAVAPTRTGSGIGALSRCEA